MTVPLSVISGRPRTRECGSCTACCTTVGVEELGKPYNTPCACLGETGCLIYDGRPAECAGYECLWLAGLGTGADRPDLAGVLWTLRLNEYDGLWYADAHELRPGVFRAMPNERFERMANSIRGTLPGHMHRLFGGVCVYPHGIPVEAGFAHRPPYPPGDGGTAGLRFERAAPGVFVYVGAEDAPGPLADALARISEDET